MKKIVPFSKDITFNTNIFEISSISLEHNLSINNNCIVGDFVVSGEYKESDSSIKTEPFIHNISVDVDIDSKYDAKKAKLEIDNFNYEIDNDNILKVNIVLAILNLEETENEIIDIIDDKIDLEEKEKENINNIEDRNTIDLFKEKEIVKEVLDENKTPCTSIFNNFNDKDDLYVTYHVHIYRENDNIESIMNTYNVSKSELEEYNNLKEIAIGSKIIIPSNE